MPIPARQGWWKNLLLTTTSLVLHACYTIATDAGKLAVPGYRALLHRISMPFNIDCKWWFKGHCTRYQHQPGLWEVPPNPRIKIRVCWKGFQRAPRWGRRLPAYLRWLVVSVDTVCMLGHFIWDLNRTDYTIHCSQMTCYMWSHRSLCPVFLIISENSLVRVSIALLYPI